MKNFILWLLKEMELVSILVITFIFYALWYILSTAGVGMGWMIFIGVSSYLGMRFLADMTIVPWAKEKYKEWEMK